MISVQNHLRLLNGNKKPLLVFLFLIFIHASCASRKPVQAVTPGRTEKAPATVTEKERAVEEPAAAKPSKKAKQETHVVSFLLPFQFNKIDEAASADAKAFDHSDLAIDFYNGARLAIDSLRNLGYSFTVNVFDSENDSTKIKAITADPLMKESELVIGPVYPNEFAGISEFSHKQKVLVVSPVSPASIASFRNPYFVLVNNTLEAHAERFALFVKEDLKAKNVIILRSNQASEERFAGSFKKKLDSVDKTILKTEVNVSKSGTSAIKPALSLQRENIIFIPSSDQAFVLTALKYIRSLGDEYKVKILGHPRWVDFPNVDQGMMQKLQVHLTTSYYPNYQDPETIRFVKLYRDIYNVEPSEFALKGFEQTLYFCTLLGERGKDLYKKFDKKKVNSTTYDFISAGSAGYQNRFLNVVKYEDFQLIGQ
jgi:ABC-type branched-subunit amino acid transport system substrate-binding protein